MTNLPKAANGNYMIATGINVAKNYAEALSMETKNGAIVSVLQTDDIGISL